MLLSFAWGKFGGFWRFTFADPCPTETKAISQQHDFDDLDVAMALCSPGRAITDLGYSTTNTQILRSIRALKIFLIQYGVMFG